MLVAFILTVFVLMLRLGGPFGVAFILFSGVIASALVRPALALGLAIPLAIIGDPVAMGWWPMTKNLSSRESILYLADPLTVRPIDLLLVTVVVVWFLNAKLGKDRKPVDFGPLAIPMAIFSATLVTGLVWGLGRNGNFRIAMFELGPLVLIPLVYLAAVNLFTTLEHYRRLFIGILIAVLIESIHGLIALPTIRRFILPDQSPLEHTAVVPMNLLFLALVATIWFGTRVKGKRAMLLLMSIPTFVLFLDTQRRAGVVALIVGGITLAAILFVRNRRLFMQIVPLILVATLVYTAALWNSESSIAFPAQAVKTIIAPGDSTAKDQSSDLYRDIENLNMHATIRSNPLLGIGFGRPFLRPLALPNISFFVFADYIPHNSLYWLWAKLGVFGFSSFVYMISVSIATGVRCATRLRDPDTAGLVAVLTAFLPMIFIVSYVEISFIPTNTALIAANLAMGCTIARLTKSDDIDLLEPTPVDAASSKTATTRALEPV